MALGPVILVLEDVPLTDERLEDLLRARPGMTCWQIARVVGKPKNEVWSRLDAWRKSGKAVLDGGWRLA